MTWRRVKPCPYQNSNSDPSAIQPVASHYTDWAIPALDGMMMLLENPDIQITRNDVLN
jgi:hypothetical protein